MHTGVQYSFIIWRTRSYSNPLQTDNIDDRTDSIKSAWVLEIDNQCKTQHLERLALHCPGPMTSLSVEAPWSGPFIVWVRLQLCRQVGQIGSPTRIWQTLTHCRQRWSHRCPPLEFGRPACVPCDFFLNAHIKKETWKASLKMSEVPILLGTSCLWLWPSSRVVSVGIMAVAWGQAICEGWRALPRTAIWCWHGAAGAQGQRGVVAGWFTYTRHHRHIMRYTYKWYTYKVYA